METILVIGATGMLGMPVSRQLKTSFNVRVFSRNTSKAMELLGSGYEYSEGDVFDENALAQAMDNCHGVHINLAGDIEHTGTESAVKVAKTKSIKRISYISGTSVCKETIWFPVEKRKYYAEQAIIGSGIPYSIFCPTWFMESIPKFVKGQKAFLFGKQPNLYHFIAAEDYAKMILKAYQKPEAANKRFILHGKQGHLFKTALEKYCAALHPGIEKITVMPYFIAKVVTTIKGKHETKNTVKFMQFFEKTGEKGSPEETYKILGEPSIGLDDWIEMQKQAKK